MRELGQLWARLNAAPARRDAAAALLFLLLGVALLPTGARLGLGAVLPEVAGPVPLWLRVLTLGIAVTATRFRSTLPRITLPLALLALALDLVSGAGGSLAIIVVVTDACYAVARYGSAALGRAQLWVIAAGTLGLATARLLLGAPPAGVLLGSVLLAAVLLLPIWWGTSIRLERDRTELERELGGQRLELLRAQQDEETRAALAADRAATGAELHDLVANQLAVIALRAEAAELGQAGGRDVTAGDLGAIAAASRSALRHLHELIGLLREEPGAPAAERGSEGVAGVLAHARALGAPVRWTGGDAEADAFAATVAGLPEDARRETLRILAEALANAARHGVPAAAGTAGVALRWRAADRDLTVTNAVPEGRAAGAAAGAGLGQRTMAERASRIGAGLVSGAAGSTASPTWVVSLTLPAPAGAGRPQQRGRS